MPTRVGSVRSSGGLLCMTQTASSGTPTLPPPPAPPVDGVGSSGSDGPKKPPRPGSMASEPLDVLLAKWRMPYAWEPEDASIEGLGKHGARAIFADAIDYARVRGVAYADVLEVIEEAWAALPDAPPEPEAGEDALEEAA
ncbi:hypothetical protein GMYAFLOJ_CDS0079 [Microbacterium phage phiMiGM15]